MNFDFLANRAADATILLVYIGTYALIAFIAYTLIKKLIKYGIDYYFNMKSMVKTFDETCEMAAMKHDSKISREKQEK